MKKLISLTVGLCFFVVACTTTQQTTSYNTLYSLEKTTTAAYDGYLETVVQGTTSTNAMPQVAKAYNTYHASAMIALDLVNYNTNAIAPANLVIEATDVVNLINTVKGK